MERRPSIDRVREMDQRGPEEFDEAKETFRQQEAELQREARIDPVGEEHPEDFRTRMEGKLRESGKGHADET